MAAATKVCGQCGGRYRGLWTIHAGTQAHIGRVRRRSDSNKLINKTNSGSKRSRRAAAARLGRMNRDAYERATRVRVRRHRRTPPNDGNVKKVQVRPYLRERPFFLEEEVNIAGERYIVKKTTAGRGVSIRPLAGRRR